MENISTSLTLEDVCSQPLRQLAELYQRYRGIVRTFHSLAGAREWMLIKIELADAAVRYARVSSEREPEQEYREPNLARERRKISRQADRLRASRAGNRVESEIRSRLESVSSLPGFLKLQEMVDDVAQRFPLYDGEEINGVINSTLTNLWRNRGGRGPCPHIRRGCWVRPLNRQEHWRRSTIVNLRFLAPAEVVQIAPATAPLDAAAA